MSLLIFTLEDGQEIFVPLHEVVTLGSENGNDVVVDDVDVSARHAEVRKRADGNFEVVDLNSASGTFVNGQRVQRQAIEAGDRIGFGPLVGIYKVEAGPSKESEADVARDAMADTDANPAKEKAEIKKLRSEKKGLLAEVAALRATALQEQSRIEEIKASAAKSELTCREQEIILSGLNARVAESQGKLRAAEVDLKAKMELLSKLRSDEKNLEDVTARLRDAETKNAQWLEAIYALSNQHDLKTAEIERLTAAAANALRDLETMNAHKEEALGHLQSLRQESAAYEERLPSLRHQSSDLEKRCQDAQILAEAREDQVNSAEKKLAAMDRQRISLDQRVAELGDAVRRLEKVKEECLKTEAHQVALSAEVTSLDQKRQKAKAEVAELETGIESLKKDADGQRAALAEINSGYQHMEELVRLIQTQKDNHESDCAAANKKLIAVRHELEVTERKHADLLQQSEDLAGTEGKLSTSKSELLSVEAQRAGLDEAVRDLEARRGKQKAILDDICREETNATKRLAALVTRENDVRQVLDELSSREMECRARFEEIQKLALDAEREHTAQIQEMKLSADQTRRELADMEIKLAPLCDWKDAMDKRYARLASLPEDSAEARELWREIESEKSGIKNLISTTSGGTRSIHLNESALTRLVSSENSAADGKKTAPGNPRLHAPPSLTDEAATPEERANVGQTGTGALISGTGQEMALKGRINRLRESVQREAVRLEFLRQERAREESRGKGGPASDIMMREQERQLENKVRREEERFATIQRKLELAGMEEDKRREKIAEMERKITELRADIAEAERKRSDARHQADLTQAELKNYEAVLDRVKKLVEV